ncbi:MAG: hypothetical protein MI919_19225, partial [Holophagales bacterium]|nr:hypothetical protein [Holophagales bacterium]
VLLAHAGDMATGSGRSIPGVHLFGFLSPWAERLERFGGHAQAVGLSIPTIELETLAREWNRAAEGAWIEQISLRQLEYEAAVMAEEVGEQMWQQLQRLAPFGQGNPRPLLRVLGPLRAVRSPRAFGRGHLEAELVGEDRGRITAVGWGWAERARELEGPIEVLGHLELDRYRGAPVLRLRDCRPSPS